MTLLSSLNFVPAPKQAPNDPKAIRRQRLIERMEEQKRLSTDPTFTPVSKRWKKAADGSKTLVDHYRRLKPWWRVDGNGNVILTVRTGFKVLEFQKGKAGISVGPVERLGAVFDTLIEATLRDTGFDDVIIKLNLTREQTMSALKEFETKASSANWAAIYFAGHGLEVDGVNYLLPVDASVVDQTSISTQTVNMDYFINAAEAGQKLRLIIIDACRNNPFAQQVRTASNSRGIGGLGSSAIGKGLGRIEPDPGTLVVYATKHGQEALDGEGNNSPFVESLVKRISQTPPIEVRRLFDFVREDVAKVTNKQQQPFAYGSLSAEDDFYFTPK